MMKRIESIDIMRGISIMGILFMNIVGFHMNEVFTNPLDYFQLPLDKILYYFDILFVHNSFYPIFSFLFGFGLAIMATNIRQRGGNFIPVLYRRVLALLAFGYIHGLLIFYGDILNVYAVLGMIAILFLLMPNIVSLITAIIISVIFLLINLMVIITVILSPEAIPFEASDNTAQHWIQVMQSGDLSQILALNQQFFLENFTALSLTGIFGYGFSVLPFILFGMYAMRADMIGFMLKTKRVMIIIAAVSLILGLLIKYYVIYAHLDIYAAQSFIFYGGTFVAICYFIAVVLLTDNQQFYKVMQPFRYAGKMSFTLYILQSICMFVIFYVFRLYAKLNLYQVFIIALLIIIFELAIATYYMKIYKHGPLEWIWRKITYLK
ncbi:DUF418 domain-containing protein [Macrococcoides canis]|nr:DUF418 domain-containing protein [Macrococcus canis]